MVLQIVLDVYGTLQNFPDLMFHFSEHFWCYFYDSVGCKVMWQSDHLWRNMELQSMVLVIWNICLAPPSMTALQCLPSRKRLLVLLLDLFKKKFKGICSSSWESIAELWSVTCHIRSQCLLPPNGWIHPALTQTWQTNTSAFSRGWKAELL